MLEFAALFALISVVFLLAQRQELKTLHHFGIPTGLAKISFNVNFIGGLITPFLLLIGMNIADFTRRASHWVGDILTARTPRTAALLTLAALFAWRLYFVIVETLEHASKVSARDHMFGLLGALGEVVLVGVVWFAITRVHRAAPDEEAMAERGATVGAPAGAELFRGAVAHVPDSRADDGDRELAVVRAAAGRTVRLRGSPDE